MILHENRLPADDYHEIACHIGYFTKKRQNLKLSSAVNYRWHFKGQYTIIKYSNQGSLTVKKRTVDKLSFLLTIIGIYLQQISKILLQWY